MTPTEQQAWDVKIRALKHAGIGMPKRVERARRELAAEAAARAEPEPPDPGPRIVPVGEVRTEATTERRKPRTRTAGKDSQTMPKVPITTDARRAEQPTTTQLNSEVSRKPGRRTFLKRSIPISVIPTTEALQC